MKCKTIWSRNVTFKDWRIDTIITPYHHLNFEDLSKKELNQALLNIAKCEVKNKLERLGGTAEQIEVEYKITNSTLDTKTKSLKNMSYKDLKSRKIITETEIIYELKK